MVLPGMFALLTLAVTTIAVVADPKADAKPSTEAIAQSEPSLSRRQLVAQAGAFSVLSGACITNSDSSCVYSDHWNWGRVWNNQRCTIVVNYNVDLTAPTWSTEPCCDKLQIGSTYYSGGSSPAGRTVSAGTVMYWRTDHSVTYRGWQICGEARLPPHPTGVANAFSVSSGSCHTNSDGSCFYSPSYPNNYGNSQTCSITVNANTELDPQAFNTESGYDWLTVNGARYQGTNAPTGVYVSAGSTISWRTDGSVTRTGFAICSGHPATPSPTTMQPTASPTTMHPTSAHPTSIAPTVSPTRSPTTVSPTQSPTRSPTTSPSTASPTTVSPTVSPTHSPTTVSPTTVSPTTRAPTTSPTTLSPTTEAPTGSPTRSPTTVAPTHSPTRSPTTASPTTVSPTRSPTTKAPSASPTPAPTSPPTNHWLQVGLEDNHFEMDATLNHLFHGAHGELHEEHVDEMAYTGPQTDSASVGPMPSLFLLMCLVGLAVAAMVTLNRRRVASADQSNRERSPLVWKPSGQAEAAPELAEQVFYQSQ